MLVTVHQVHAISQGYKEGFVLVGPKFSENLSIKIFLKP